MTQAAGFRGAIFDVDGVLVDSPHERAWRDAFQQMMDTEWSDVRERTTYAPDRFTPQVYQQVMSGKPRMAGARAVLEYFEVPDVESRIGPYADRKQAMITELIKAGEFHAYDDALRFILAVKGAGILVGAASSSKNAHLFLEQIRLDTFASENALSYDFVTPGLSLLDIFDVNLSGKDFERGKPDPMMFLAVAEEFPAAPQDCFVIEDAVSGIQAAKAGNMTGLAIARAGDEAALGQAGADLVVTSLDDVSIDGLRSGRVEPAGGR